jgi:hypothetical protein
MKAQEGKTDKEVRKESVYKSLKNDQKSIEDLQSGDAEAKNGYGGRARTEEE